MIIRFLLLTFAVVFSLPCHGQAPTGVRTADASCEACHEKIFRSYLLTPMAGASGKAVDNVREGEYNQNSNGYRIHRTDGRLFLEYKQSQPPLSGSRTLDYFLGSGHLGTTYLYSMNGYLLESPVAYYAASGHLDMKPGIPVSDTVAAALPVRPACLRCHMSAVQPSDAGTINHYQALPFLNTSITCEACHGSTAEHVASGGKAAVMNPAKLDETKRDAVCISCHLEGDVSVEKARHSALNYRPGDSISDSVAYFVFSGKELTRRGVSEVEQLSASVCKRSSGPKMSCSSCHDPHATPAVQDRAQFYRSKCLACHTGPTFAAEHHPENPDCTRCHMPRTGSENIAHVAWTDHRILKNPQQGLPLDPMMPGDDVLTPIFSPDASARDLGLAYYNASFNGKPQLQAKAYSILKAHEAELTGDTEALDALGSMHAAKGDYAEARRLYAQVLKLDGADFTAATNLGTLFAKSGDLSRAITAWQPAFQRNQDIPGLGENLALAQCRQGDAVGARITLETVLMYSPGIERVRNALAMLPDCGTGHK